MRILAFFVFGLGIALAGGGVFFVSEFLKEQRAGNVNIQSQMVRVLVAKGRLRPDTVLGAENLQWAEWPSHAIPPGAFTSIEALFGDKADQKRIVRRTIEPGEPILDGKIWGLGAGVSARTAGSIVRSKRTCAPSRSRLTRYPASAVSSRRAIMWTSS
jgi:pilus assembly protein CpaB